MNISDPFIGLTLYMWLWIFLSFFTICVWLTFRYGVWSKYEVLWGLYYAYKAQSKAAFIFNLDLKAELFSESQAKCIFDYASYKYTGFSTAFFGLQGKVESLLFNYATIFLDDLDPLTAVVYKFGHRNMDVEIAKKLQNYEWDDRSSSISIGGTDTDIVLDSNRWTVKNSPQHKAIVNYCEIHNDGNPNDQIHSYMKFQRYLNEGKIAATGALAVIEPQTIVPWVRIDSAFPIDVEDNEQAGARRQHAEDEMNADANQFNKYIPHVLGFGVLFAFVIVGIRFAAFAMTKH